MSQGLHHVDDFTAGSSQHQVLQRHRQKSQAAATERQSPGGGLAEYYSEGETRIPSWLVIGDKQRHRDSDRPQRSQRSTAATPTPTSPRAGSMTAEPPTATAVAQFTDKSVHGFDLTFAAPKSVSLIRALTDDVAEKVLATAHTAAVHAAMEYLHRHAGYTRVHNPITGNKDLQRLPGLVAIAYQHETSRCGDPHLHTHVIVPNRQPRRRRPAGVARLQKPVPRGQSRRHHLPGHPAPPAARRARLRIQPRRPAHRDGRDRRRRPATASKRGRSAPPGCANGRATTSSSSTANPPPRNWPPRRRPPGPPSPNRCRGPTSKQQWRADARGLTSGPRRALSRRAPNAAHSARRTRRGRASPRWRRTSTSPRSPAPTWSN